MFLLFCWVFVDFWVCRVFCCFGGFLVLVVYLLLLFNVVHCLRATRPILGFVHIDKVAAGILRIKVKCQRFI